MLLVASNIHMYLKLDVQGEEEEEALELPSYLKTCSYERRTLIKQLAG